MMRKQHKMNKSLKISSDYYDGTLCAKEQNDKT